MKRIIFLLLLIALILTVNQVWAMTSANYRLGWFTPLTTSGGGAANSINYAINLTIGQSVTGVSSSANFQAGWGYWPGVGGSYRVSLPLILK